MSPLDDFFAPAIRELVTLDNAAVALQSQPLRNVILNSRIVMESVARDERAQHADGRAVPLITGHGDSENFVAAVQMTARGIIEQIQQPERPLDAPLIQFADPFAKLILSVRAVLDHYSHALPTERSGLDVAAAQLSAAVAIAQLAQTGASLEERTSTFRDLEARTNEIETRSREAVEQAEQAAGISSQDDLAKHFETVKLREKTNGFRLRVAAGSLAVGGPVVGVVAASQKLDHPLAIALALGIAGLGAYLGRLAEGHMKIARWAATLEVQTKGIYGYSRLIRDRTAQDRVLEAFATHAYTGHPGAADGSESPPSAALEVERLMRLMIDVQKKSAA